MYSADLSNFSNYKSNDNYSLAVDTAVLLFKISSLVSSIEQASGSSFQDELDLINSSLNSILSSISLVEGHLSSPSSSLLEKLAEANTNSVSRELLLTDIQAFLNGTGANSLVSRLNISSIVDSLSSILTKLNSSLDNPAIVASVETQISLSQNIHSRLDVTNNTLTSLNTYVSSINSLLIAVRDDLRSISPVRNVYPNFMSLTVPSYPGVQLYRFPSTMSSLSFTLINPPASPDTLNTYALFSFKIDDIFVPDANNCPPCPDDASVFDSWYPLFFGAEETLDSLAIPSDKELVFQISSLGATSDLKLAVKFWTSTPFLPSVSTIPAP